MIGIIIITVVALIMSLILVFASSKVDTKESKIRELLPGYNCGGCGYGSCDGMAKALSLGTGDIEKCRPMKKEEKEKLKEYIKEVLNRDWNKSLFFVILNIWWRISYVDKCY